MGRKILLVALPLLLCFFMGYYIVNEVYTISNFSLLLGTLISTIICSMYDTDFFEKTVVMLLIVVGGACLGLGFWLWPITIVAFLALRTFGNKYYGELSAGYIIAQILVEGGIILIASIFMLGVISLIKMLAVN